MEKIRAAFDQLISSRKGVLSLIGLVGIGVFLSLVAVGFVVDWYLSSKVLSGENLKDIMVAGFQYTSVIIGAYSAANLADKAIFKMKDQGKKR